MNALSNTMEMFAEGQPAGAATKLCPIHRPPCLGCLTDFPQSGGIPLSPASESACLAALSTLMLSMCQHSGLVEWRLYRAN